MSIFGDNINPSIPDNWNNACYDIFVHELYKKLHTDSWWYYVSGGNNGQVVINKNDIKRRLQNMKRLPKKYQDALQETVNKIYSKYGVFAKWKVHVGKNGRIKNVYFVKL